MLPKSGQIISTIVTKHARAHRSLTKKRHRLEIFSVLESKEESIIKYKFLKTVKHQF